MIGKIINLTQLKQSHYNITSFFIAQDFPIIFQMCGMDDFEDPICMFYGNPCLFQDNSELETPLLK